MDFFYNMLPWRIDKPQELHDLFGSVSEASLAADPIIQISEDTSLENLSNLLQEHLNKKQKQNKDRDNVRGYRQIPESGTTQLSDQDHKEYLQLLMLYSEGNQHVNKKIKTSMELTQHLEPIIQAERKKYSEFVKNQWMINGNERCKQIQNEIQNFFDEEWTKRIQIIDQYPAYYSTERMIPIFPKEEVSIEMKCVDNLFEMGNIHSLPKQPDKKRIFLDSNKFKHSDFYNYSNKPECSYTPGKNQKCKHSAGVLIFCPRLDPTAEQLAKYNKADIVISASGMKNIMNNHAPYHNTWNLPVKIKEHSVTVDGKTISKKIIYIDKALPKNYLNNVQKNYWVYKKILKSNFCKGISHRFGKPIVKNTTACNCSNTSDFDLKVGANDEDDYNNISSENDKNLSFDETNDFLTIDLPETEQVTNEDILKTKFKRIEPIFTRSRTKRSISPTLSPSTLETKRLKIVDEISKSNSIEQNSKFNITNENSNSNNVKENLRSNSLEKNFKFYNTNENSNSNDTKPNLKSCNIEKNAIAESEMNENLNSNSMKKRCKCKIAKQLKGINVTYKLWNLKLESNRLRRTTSQEINILVRCKIDTCQKKFGESHPIILTPKLEYQLEYGAEMCTKVDLCRQWISTTLLPGSKLIRVRIDPSNSEFILWDETNTSKIANELNKFYNYNPNIGFQCLYSVLADIIKSPPGEYMLSHNPKNGPFICFKRSCENKSNFNMDINDLKNFYTKEETNFPFISIDSNVILPNHIKHGVIPGLFKGAAKVIIPQSNSKNGKKKYKKNRNNINKKKI